MKTQSVSNQREMLNARIRDAINHLERKGFPRKAIASLMGESKNMIDQLFVRPTLLPSADKLEALKAACANTGYRALHEATLPEEAVIVIVTDPETIDGDPAQELCEIFKGGGSAGETFYRDAEAADRYADRAYSAVLALKLEIKQRRYAGGQFRKQPTLFGSFCGVAEPQMEYRTK